MADCARCGAPDADALFFCIVVCPKCYTAMSEPLMYDDVPEAS